MSDETPDDIATLYSWANLRGAKYRDFSAARARVRENARQRVQEAIEAENQRAKEQEKASAGSVPNALPEMPVAAPAGTPLGAEGSEPVRTPATGPVASGVTQGVIPASAPDSAPDSVPVRVRAVDSASARPFPADTVPFVQSTEAPQWYALKNIFPATANKQSIREQLAPPSPGRVPVTAVFSLAGGVGKSSLVATLGRALSARGERVLLVDTAAFGTLQFFFGAHDTRPGVLRTFLAPEESGSVPVDLLTLDPDGLEQENLSAEPLTQEIMRNALNSNRILVDLSTASGATVRRILRMSPTVLIPVTPDVRSVASVGAIEAFFQRNPSGMGQIIAPVYVLNYFDEQTRLHQDVREMLRGQLGDRLLPFVLHRTPIVSEALAEGLTVVDYAPGSQVAKDYETLAEWVRSLAAPLDQVYRAVRWSER